MKKIFTMTLVFASFYACSQRLDEASVPQVVKDAFTKMHPKTTAAWEREGANYEANFKEGTTVMSCIITKQGTILETESAIAASELPATAKKYMDQYYKGKKWKEVAKIQKANGDLLYEVNVGTDVLFDASGNHLVKKEEKEKN